MESCWQQNHVGARLLVALPKDDLDGDAGCVSPSAGLKAFTLRHCLKTIWMVKQAVSHPQQG